MHDENMRRYDYSFIRKLGIRTSIVSMMNRMEILKIRQKEMKKEDPEAFISLESIARLQSVKGSNAIEGIVTTDKRIKAIVNENSAPLNHDERDIAGYRDVLDMIHGNHASIDISEETILRMHEMMLSYTTEGGGRYKDTNNLIISVDGEGNRNVVFRPVLSSETKRSMEQLMLAYIDARDDSGIDNMILIPCFILDLLCIHPFSDGNGRISRLLSLLMMYNIGIDIGRYISFESQINRYKGDYYEALRMSSEGWHTNENDYLPFVENFIFTLFRCFREMDKRFAVLEDKRINKGNRVEATVINSIGPISKSDIKEILPDVSSRTIEVKLSELLKEGKIRKKGTFKDAHYFRL
jgi:Fic family protein